MLVFFTAGSFLYWFGVAVFPFANRRFINRHLEMSEMPFDSIGNILFCIKSLKF